MAAIVKLTKPQLFLLDALLFAHIVEGSYWGKKRDHEKLCLATRAKIMRARRKEGKG